MTNDEPTRRETGIRHDINALVRDPRTGDISGSKIGTYVGQYIAARLLLTAAPLPTWDVLAILFTVLIAPLLWGKFIEGKFGTQGDGRTESTTSQQSSSTVTTTGKGAKVDTPEGS